MKAVCEITGLSDAAAKLLSQLVKYKRYETIEMLNFLLEDFAGDFNEDFDMQGDRNREDTSSVLNAVLSYMEKYSRHENALDYLEIEDVVRRRKAAESVVPSAVQFADLFFLYSVPHASIASRMGLIDCPSSEREYSTRGGTSGYAVRTISPSSSIERRLSESTLWLIPSRSFLSSLNRQGRIRKLRIISIFHLLPISATVVATGQAGIFSLVSIFSFPPFLL